MQHARTESVESFPTIPKKDLVETSPVVEQKFEKPNRSGMKGAMSPPIDENNSSFVEISLSSQPYLHYFNREEELKNRGEKKEASAEKPADLRKGTREEWEIAEREGTLPFEKGILEEKIVPPTRDYRFEKKQETNSIHPFFTLTKKREQSWSGNCGKRGF